LWLLSLSAEFATRLPFSVSGWLHSWRLLPYMSSGAVRGLAAADLMNPFRWLYGV
jgi:hypothetical protein